jgi:hypothetical protein
MRISRIKKLFFIFILWSSLLFANGERIRNYQRYFAYLSNPGVETQIIVRKFQQGSRVYFLTVGVKDLKTSIISTNGLKPVEDTWPDLRETFANTPYFKAIADSEKNAKTGQDAGITHFLPTERGINLTIDLCPSKKPLDRNLFKKILLEFGKIEKPVALAISLSGLWIKDHPNDLKWLVTLIRKHEITVDWINHSFSHPYSKKLPFPKNFLLEKGVNIDKEILKNEVTMIQNNLIPSVFFRFPGLVSNLDVFKQVIDYGLIPIGSDAWLAKGQKPGPGSIVLIHGNGNEPLGIKKFFELLKNEKADIKKKNWLLYDLRESVSKNLD